MNAVISLGFMAIILLMLLGAGRAWRDSKARRAWKRLPAVETNRTSRKRGIHLAGVLNLERHLGFMLAVPAGLAVYLLTGMILLVPIAGIGVFIAVRWARRRAVLRRRNQLQGQVVELVEALVQPLRAGLSLSAALAHAADDLPAPLAGEVSRTVRDLELGMPLSAALVDLAGRCESDDLRLATNALLEQRAAGGNLPQLLDGLKSTIRDRAMLTREIKALTAQGRLSGYLVASLPAAFLAIECVFSRAAVRALFTHPLGWLVLAVGLGLETLGLLCIRRICTPAEVA